MIPIKKTLIGVAVAATLGLGGGAYVYASGDEGETSVTGPQADKATAAALKITGGGTANAVERDDEKGATWEVEVTKPNGTTVDVRLDASYELVVVDGDSEGADDADDAGEGGDGAQ